MVGVKDDVRACGGDFGFRHLSVGSGHHDKRLVGRNFSAEALDESERFIRSLCGGLDEYRIGSGFDIGAALRNAFFIGSFASDDNHEVIGDLRGLTFADQVAEVAGLRLFADCDRRNAKALKGTHEERELFLRAAGISVVDYRLGGYFENVVQCTEARGHVHAFGVGLALQHGIRVGAEPHAVEFVGAVVLFDGCLLDYETGKAAVRIHHADERFCVQEAAQTCTADVGSGADFLDRLVQLGRGNARSILGLHQFAAPLRESVDDALAGLRLHTLTPVGAVHNVVGLELEKIGDVIELFLGNDLGDALELRDDGGALLVVHVREALVAGDGGISKDAHRDVAKLGGFLDDIQMSRMDDIR